MRIGITDSGVGGLSVCAEVEAGLRESPAGQDIEVVYLNASLGGDPLELDVYGMSLSLRRQQARCFGVSRIGADPGVQRRG